MKYENERKFGTHNISFDLQSARKDVFLNNPFPGNDKFEPPRLTKSRLTSNPPKLDFLSHYRDDKKAP